MGHSDSEDDSSKSETEIREQTSFTDRLGMTDWCKCAKCTPMPSEIEFQCCCTINELKEHLMEHSGDNLECVTDHKQFMVVCLNKDVLYTALVTMKMVSWYEEIHYVFHCLTGRGLFYSNNSSLLNNN